MIPIKEWWESPEIQKLLGLPVGRLMYNEFHRDSCRAIVRNNDIFYSPADGIVIYKKDKVKWNKKILDIKGIEYTPYDLMGEKDMDYEDYLVIGVFMTFYDVHINRMPTDGILSYEQLDYIHTKNIPMAPFEFGLTENKIKFKLTNDYTFKNSRALNRVYVPQLEYEYFMVQIADEDTNLIVPYHQNDSQLQQGDRFGVIRYGSQVNLLLPWPPPEGTKFNIEAKFKHHVLAGVDPLVRLY